MNQGFWLVISVSLLVSCFEGQRDLVSILISPGKSVHFFVVWSFVVWAVRVFIFLLFGRGRGLFFAVWARAWAPPKQQQKTRARPNSKKINTPPPLPSVFCFLLFGRVGVFIFVCCLGGGRVYLFAVWAGGRFFFFLCCLGGVVFVFFAVWARGVFFLLFGRRTGVHSLIGLPGSSARL